MAVVCSTRDYIIELVSGSSNQYFYWDKVDKVLRSRAYSSISDYYVLNNGSIIDVVESGGVVYLVTKGDQSLSIINYNPLSSTSGDFNNKLLSASVSGDTLTVVMYALIAKETTTLTYTMQTITNDSPAEDIIPCFNDFLLADGTIITQWCDGFTLHQIIFSQSPFGANETTTANSVICGYSAPADPFRVSEEKLIEFRGCVLNNPVYIVWKNTLGGWDYWLFQRNQTENLTTNSLGSYREDYNRIGDTTNPNKEIGKSASKKIILGTDDLDRDRVSGLSQLLYSNKKYILNANGTINREINILEGSFILRDTDGEKHSLEFQIEDVEINTIKN